MHYSYSIATTHIFPVECGDSVSSTHHSHYHIGIPLRDNLRMVYHDTHPISTCKGPTQKMSVLSSISLETLGDIRFPIEIIDNWSDAEAQILSKVYCPLFKEQFDHKKEINRPIQIAFQEREVVFRERDRLEKEQEERLRICELQCQEIEGF